MMAFENFKIVEKKGYRAIGMQLSVAWSEVRKLQPFVSEMSERVNMLPYAVEPNKQLGLSYHNRPDGFTHYSMYEVLKEQEVPEGMIEKRIPSLTYLVTEYRMNENSAEIYNNILAWLNDNGYQPYVESGATYFDALPIKHEKYVRN